MSIGWFTFLIATAGSNSSQVLNHSVSACRRTSGGIDSQPLPVITASMTRRCIAMRASRSAGGAIQPVQRRAAAAPARFRGRSVPTPPSAPRRARPSFGPAAVSTTALAVAVRDQDDALRIDVLAPLQPLDDVDDVVGVFDDAGVFGPAAALTDAALVEAHDEVAGRPRAGPPSGRRSRRRIAFRRDPDGPGCRRGPRPACGPAPASACVTVAASENPDAGMNTSVSPGLRIFSSRDMTVPMSSRIAAISLLAEHDLGEPVPRVDRDQHRHRHARPIQRDVVLAQVGRAVGTHDAPRRDLVQRRRDLALGRDVDREARADLERRAAGPPALRRPRSSWAAAPSCAARPRATCCRALRALHHVVDRRRQAERRRDDQRLVAQRAFDRQLPRLPVERCRSSRTWS